MQVLTGGNKKEKKEPEEEMIKTTWRMPKSLLKRLKQYGLDNDMTLQQVAYKSFNDLLSS